MHGRPVGSGGFRSIAARDRRERGFPKIEPRSCRPRPPGLASPAATACLRTRQPRRPRQRCNSSADVAKCATVPAIARR